MSLSFHLDFNGQCEEAFAFYATELGGRISFMLRGRDAPGTTPAWQQDKVVHASLLIDGVQLSGADVEPQRYEKPAGFHVLLGVASEQRVDAAFEALQAHGTVILPPQRTFWSPRYAIVVDRFGVPWKINCGT